jgi:hypothetical protein
VHLLPNPPLVSLQRPGDPANRPAVVKAKPACARACPSSRGGWSRVTRTFLDKLGHSDSLLRTSTSTRRFQNRPARGLTAKAEVQRPGLLRWNASSRNELRPTRCLGSAAPPPNGDIAARPTTSPKRPSGGRCLGVSLLPPLSGYQGVRLSIGSENVMVRPGERDEPSSK